MDGLFGHGVSKIVEYLIYEFGGVVKSLTYNYKCYLSQSGLYNVDFDKNMIEYSTHGKQYTVNNELQGATVMDTVISLAMHHEKNKDLKGLTLDVMIQDIQTTLFVAQDTTAATAQIGFYLLASNPKLQQFVYDELRTVAQRYQHSSSNVKSVNLQFSFNFLNQLHIFRAFIHDVIRLTAASPQGLPRKAVKTFDITLSNGKKYIIRKNDQVFINIAYINLIEWQKMYGNNNNSNDLNTKELIFGDNVYNTVYLNAWLDKKGHFVYNQNDATFAWGERSCPGRYLCLIWD